MDTTAPGTTPPAPQTQGLLEMSDSFGQIAAALAAAQAEFPELIADSEGAIEGESKASGKAFSFSYDYASLGQVLATFRPVLARHGVAILQPTQHGPQEGAITVRVQTWLVHKSGEWIRSKTSTVIAPGGDMKKVGGAITYARRYQIGALLGVAPEEDTDDGGGQRKANIPRAPGAPGRFTCSHGHKHDSAAEAKACAQKDQASPPEKLEGFKDIGGGPALEPGQDPAAMDGPTPESIFESAKANVERKDWRGAMNDIGLLPRNHPLRKQAESIYAAARNAK